MKKPRETKKEVDLTTLLTPEQLMYDIPEEDCFGKLWDPQCADCAICADVEICGIVHQSIIKKKVRNLEKKAGTFLDMTAFERVDFEELARGMKNYADEGNPFTYDELVGDIKKVARTKDPVAVREYIKAWLPRVNMTITEDKTIVPYEGISDNIKHYPVTPEDSIPSSRV